MWWLLVIFYIAWPLLFLRLGWKGKRMDHHPTCRRCRFDLINLLGKIGTCPECGADLDRWRAVTIGNRRHAWWGLIVGSLLLLVNLSIGVLIAARQYEVDRLACVKPDWLLQQEAESSIQRVSGFALFELEERMREGSLSDARINELVETALDCQADPTCAFHGLWMSFVEAAWEVGAIAPEQYGRCFVQGVVFEGECVISGEEWDGKSPRIRVDGELHVADLVVHGRAALVNRWSDDRLRLELIEHEGVPVPWAAPGGSWRANPSMTSLHAIRATWDITIMDGRTELITVRTTIDHLVDRDSLPR